MKVLSLIGLLITCHLSSAQYALNVDLIPSNLRENANKVIRNSVLDIDVKSLKSQEVYFQNTVTILSSSKEEFNLYAFYDRSSKIKDISLQVYNCSGKEIFKSSKKDFQDQSAVDAGTIHSDNRVKKITYIPKEYPFTYQFSYRIKSTNTAFIPQWYPLSDYNTSIEKSSFRLKTHKDISFKYLQKNFKEQKIIKKETANEVFFELIQARAKIHESYSPRAASIFPLVKVALNNFHLEGEYGTNESWASLSKWYEDKLLSPQLNLGLEDLKEIEGLISGLKDDYSKAARIYRYIQNKCRYISIQLGIGGWKPIATKEVHQLGYGDCKGLTLYMHDLLKLVGIDSKYCITSAGNEQKNIESELPSLQGNHVFLCIPQAEDSIWVECTAPNSPFGEVGAFTDDRLVFVIDGEQGKITRSKIYSHDKNGFESVADIRLNLDKPSTAVVKRTNKGTFLYREYLAHLDAISQKRRLKTEFCKLSTLNMSALNFPKSFEKDSYVESYTLESDELLRVLGDDLLVPIFPFSERIVIPDILENRINPIVIPRNIQKVYKSVFQLPRSYSIVNQTEKIKIKSHFGSYTIQMKELENEKLEIMSTLCLNKGVYSKELYGTFRKFFKQISKADNQKLILNKL